MRRESSTVGKNPGVMIRLKKRKRGTSSPVPIVGTNVGVDDAGCRRRHRGAAPMTLGVDHPRAVLMSRGVVRRGVAHLGVARRGVVRRSPHGVDVTPVGPPRQAKRGTMIGSGEKNALRRTNADLQNGDGMRISPVATTEGRRDAERRGRWGAEGARPFLHRSFRTLVSRALGGRCRALVRCAHVPGSLKPERWGCRGAPGRGRKPPPSV